MMRPAGKTPDALRGLAATGGRRTQMHRITATRTAINRVEYDAPRVLTRAEAKHLAVALDIATRARPVSRPDPIGSANQGPRTPTDTPR